MESAKSNIYYARTEPGKGVQYYKDKNYKKLTSYNFNNDSGIVHFENAILYLVKGNYHRKDGPAYECNGYKMWFVNGCKIDCSTQQEFLQLIRLEAFW